MAISYYQYQISKEFNHSNDEIIEEYSLNSLSAVEHARFHKMSQTAAQNQFIQTRILRDRAIRQELSQRGLSEPKYLEMEYTPEGKPRLAGREFEFSMAHSGDYLVVACANDPIGVDIECPKDRDLLQVAQRFFHPEEVEFLNSKLPDLSHHFYKIWTLKEAWVKCLSSQLAKELKQSTIDLFPELFLRNSEDSLNYRVQGLHARGLFEAEIIIHESFVMTSVLQKKPLHQLFNSLRLHPIHLIPAWTPLKKSMNNKQHLLNSLHIKDDSYTSEYFGGNKVRKLEYFIGDYLEENKYLKIQRMVTLGFKGSNHCVVTSMVAKNLGCSCSVFLKDQHPAPYVDLNTKLHLELGTHIWTDEHLECEKPFPSLEDLEPLVDSDEHILWVPPGGTHPSSHWGFVNGAMELAYQWVSESTDPRAWTLQDFANYSAQAPDKIYMACGTTGSCLGLMVGLKLLGWKTQVVAVQVVPEFLVSEFTLMKALKKFNKTLVSHGMKEISWSFDDFKVHKGAYGEGYAIPTIESEQAVLKMRREEGLELEWTYTGKVIDALQQDLVQGELKDQKVIFWNTYGVIPRRR